MAKKSIYALLIAIDAYPVGIKSLNGCLGDRQAFEDYLSNQCDTTAFDLKKHVIEDEDATRAAIIADFQHFKPATEGDVCILYFSGHGTQVKAPLEFWEPKNGLVEALVCFDTCLVDKELSCLIYEAMKDKQGVHFLSVMDCCHSGSNTRYDDGVVVRMSNPLSYPKTIQEYYGFNENLNLYVQRKEDGKYSANKAQHINFSACRSDQTAKETLIGEEIRGAFTSSLIEALETSPTLMSYTDLAQRVGQKIANRVGEQLPLVDAVMRANPAMPFLGGAVTAKNRYFVAWNRKSNSWELNAGVYQGMSKEEADPSVITQINGLGVFTIDQILPAKSLGKWAENGFQPNKNTQYDVQVVIGGGQQRGLAFASDCDANIKAILLAYLSKVKPSYIHLTEKAEEAAFFIHGNTQKPKDVETDEEIEGLWLRRKSEKTPIFHPIDVEAMGIAQAIEFWQKADSVMQWFHLKNLENPTTSIKPEEINIALFRSQNVEEWWEKTTDSMEKIADWSKPTTFQYINQLEPSFALTIENKGTRRLFVSALYMSGRFGIDNSYLPSEELEQNKPISMILMDESSGKTAESISLSINDELYGLGRKEQMDYIKIIVSTERLNTSGFVQDGLNVVGSETGMRDGAKAIGRKSAINQPDWVSYLVPLHIVRP